MSGHEVPPGAGGKLPGKATWAGRRRPMTRKSGFAVRGPGSELRYEDVRTTELKAGESLSLSFSYPNADKGVRLAYGGWFCIEGDIEVQIEGGPPTRVAVVPDAPNWGKFGSQWISDGEEDTVSVAFHAKSPGRVALYGVLCGRVEHEYISDARAALLTNMYSIAPEANFIAPDGQGNVEISAPRGEGKQALRLALKSCNRCARFLPVNLDDERIHLSFSNHCVADHRRPCSHAGFGRLREVDADTTRQLEYGYQLECRFCKKFEVNAAHNPQRTAAQMKEDATRRRAFELLLEHLYEGTPQLRYRQEYGGELTDEVFKTFEGRCFKCGAAFAAPNDMALDHTRPLALLWPLDRHATSLCTTHNSEKRDRPPGQYYTAEELERLAEATGLPLQELKDPSPNLVAIRLLEERLDWFFETFLQLPELQEIRDGKRTADLLLKALVKALARTPGGAPFDLAAEAKRRGYAL